MARINSEGIHREDLLLTLRTPHLVELAIDKDRCLICSRNRVNQAGICEYCYSQLDGEELRVAGRWIDGIGP